jgi:thiol-disulfide isomerase/thioredoxin
VLALVGVAVLGIAALLATQLGGDAENSGKDASTEVARVRVRGAALPPLPEGDDPAIGTPAPQLRGTVLGERGSIRIPAEGAKIVMFVAHWCPHCQREVPVITKWIDDNGAPEGVDLYAVSTGVAEERGNYPPSAWLAEEGWPVRTMADDESNSAATAYGLTAYPFFVVTDKDGNVVFRTSGELTTEQLESLVTVAGGSA